MKQWIRWSGLAGFVVVTGLLVAFFMLAAAPLIKSSIEHFGSQAAGAQVSVDDVALNFSPLGVTLTGLQVADSEQPMENLLQFEQAVAELELAPLLLGKGIVRDLSVTDLRFNTARQVSGALPQTEEPEQEVAIIEENAAQEESPLALTELPSAEEILAREPLRTESAGNQLQQHFSQHQQAVDETLAQVPDDQALAAYQQQLQTLLSGDIKSLQDFNQRKQKLEQLKKQFKQDKAAVAAAKQAISQARTDIAASLTELKNAPSADLQHIKSKYRFDAGGAANISGLLFGEQAAEWAEKALYWYGKLKPYLASDEASGETEERQTQRAGGRFVHFPSDNPWPEFLIRRAQLSAPALGGFMQIEATDITHQPALLGRPARVVIQGQQLTAIDDLNLEAVLDHRRQPGKDTLTMAIKDWQLQPVDLGIAGTQLSSARVQLQGLAVLAAGQLQAQADAQVVDAQFEGQGKTQFAKEMTRALAGINRFDVQASANGKLTSPKVKLGSDLDKQLNAAFQQRLKEKQTELENKLQAQLNEKVQSYLGDYSDELTQLNQLDGSLDDKSQQLQQMASRKLDSYEDKQKQRAKQKQQQLKDKAKDKLKNLF